jgi:hypothetical protein
MHRKQLRSRWPPILSARRGGSCRCLHPSGDAFPLPQTTTDRVEGVARDSHKVITVYRIAAMPSGNHGRDRTLEAAANVFRDGFRADPSAKMRP